MHKSSNEDLRNDQRVMSVILKIHLQVTKNMFNLLFRIEPVLKVTFFENFYWHEEKGKCCLQ